MTHHRTLYDRVFVESKEKQTFWGSVKKAADTFREYADVSDPTHPWHKILSTAQKWSDQGGALGDTKAGGEVTFKEEKPKKSKTSDILKPKRRETKIPESGSALRDVKQATRAARYEREQRARGPQQRKLPPTGSNQPGSQAHRARERKAQTRARRDRFMGR